MILYYKLYIVFYYICTHYKLEPKVSNQTSQNWGAYLYTESAQSVFLRNPMTETGKKIQF